MQKLTSFSRSNRNLILTVDLVTALADTLHSDGPMPRKTIKCIDRINARVKNIQEILYGGSTLVLSPAHYRKYSRIIQSIKKLIDNISGDVVELDFFNAVLRLVEDARLGCRKSKDVRLHREWNYLNQSLATLYSHVDPDLDQHNWMILGDNLATRFSKIIVAD